MFKLIKRYYDKGVYIKDDVKIFVINNKITEKQYLDITGEDYL